VWQQFKGKTAKNGANLLSEDGEKLIVVEKQNLGMSLAAC
jgi:hypothetical protein